MPNQESTEHRDVDFYRRESRHQTGKLAGLIGDWRRRKGFKTGWLNVPEKLMLIVTELAEAMEAYRKLPTRVLSELQSHAEPRLNEEADAIITNFQEELADVFIRLLDLSDALGFDLHAAACEKMAINEGRPHKHGKER